MGSYETSGSGFIICKICGRDIMTHEDFVLCPDCASPFHKGCWRVRGGCGNPNCKSFVNKQTSNASAMGKIVYSLNENGERCLQCCEYGQASVFYKKALEYESKNSISLLGLVLAECKAQGLTQLEGMDIDLEKSEAYKSALVNGSSALKKTLEDVCKKIKTRKEENEKRAKEKAERIEKIKNSLSQVTDKIKANEKQIDSLVKEEERIKKEIATLRGQVESLNKDKSTLEDQLFVLDGIGVYGDVTPTDSKKFIVSKSLHRLDTTIIGVADKDITTAVIPSVIDGKEVRGIGINAFKDCKKLRLVILPNTVTTIEESAFEGCEMLSMVVIHYGVTEIGFGAFMGCISLSNITLPDSVRKIEGYAFWGDKRLQRITLGKSVSSIGERTFWSCDSLSSIFIPKSVSMIRKNAFENCHSLTIHCERKAPLSGWDEKWNSSNRPVIWGKKGNDSSDTNGDNSQDTGANDGKSRTTK